MSFLLAYQVIQELRINAAILHDIDRPGVEYIDVQAWLECIDDEGVQAAYEAFNTVRWEDDPALLALTAEALKSLTVAKAGRSCFRLPGGKQPRVSAAPAGTVLPMDTPRGR